MGNSGPFAFGSLQLAFNLMNDLKKPAMAIAIGDSFLISPTYENS